MRLKVTGVERTAALVSDGDESNTPSSPQTVQPVVSSSVSSSVLYETVTYLEPEEKFLLVNVREPSAFSVSG